ncbi:MAG: AEC family transporter [Halanaerobium sp.]
MADLYPVLEQLLLMGVLIALGFYLNRSGKIKQAAEKGIAELTIDIAFPALIFTNIVRDFDLEMLRQYLIVPFSALIITVISIVIIFLITHSLSFKKREQEEFAFVSVFSNNIFVGAPICLALFGAQGLILAILYDFGMQLILWTVGIWLLKDSGQNAESHFLANIFSPPIVGLLLGLTVVLSGVSMPGSVINITDSIGVITVPLAMIFIGLQLAKSTFAEVMGNQKVYLVSFLRLILFPALVYFGLGLFKIDPLLRGVMTIEAAMPVFASSSVIMEKYGHKSEFASAAIFATIVFMGLTLPVFIWLIV